MCNYKHNQYLVLDGKKGCHYIGTTGNGRHIVQVKGVLESVYLNQLARDGRKRNV